MVREFGLIGKEIGHSFSAEYFNRKFRREGIEAEYRLFELADIDELPGLLTAHPHLRGLNVTSPYKRDVIKYLDRISPAAQEIGAVNTIVVRREPEGIVTLEGHNTDCEGFGRTVDGIQFRRALIMGSGGAAAAVKRALTDRGIESQIASRTPKEGQISYEEMNALLPCCDLLINATPLGMHHLKDKTADVDFGKIDSRHLCYDLIYNPEETTFLRKARERGAKTKNGLEMLYGQAEAAWEIWNGNGDSNQ